jgi:hypothetical protein
MSKHPSPKIDQLRAMREAKFARNEQRQREDAAVPEKPAKKAAAETPAKSAAADKPAKSAPKKKAAKKPKAKKKS